MAAVFAITAEGPGSLSIDRRRWGTAWAMAQLAAGVGGALALVKYSESQPPEPPEASSERFTRETETEGVSA
jgi:hypothetical protein